MGWLSLPSHMDSGLIFGLLGLWHLFSVLHSYASNPKTFRSRAWFPAPLRGRLQALELWILLVIVLVFISKQLSHAGVDLRTGVIRAEHLMRFQHVVFSLMYLVYISVALIDFNSLYLCLPDGALQGTFALGFLSELVVFHFGHHPGDDLEHYVHMLMQLILVAVISLMFLEISRPSSVVIAAARAMCLTLKGTWFFYIGVLINIPSSIPLGCAIPEGHDFPACGSPMDDRRAKAIQILIFNMQIVVVVALTFACYGSLRWILRHQEGDKENYQELPEPKEEDGNLVVEGEEQLIDDDSQFYYVVDTDGGFRSEVEKAGVPILKDLPRSLSRRLSKRRAKSANHTPRGNEETPTPLSTSHGGVGASPLARNLLMVSSPIHKNLKNV